jgi:hypothetical protein
MKLIALFWVSGALVIAGTIRFDLFAQESAAGGRKGLNPPRDKHHLVFPVQTELQRLSLGYDISVVVTLDPMGVVKDGAPTQVALEEIRRDLAGVGAKDGIVYFRIFHDRTSPPNENKRLHDALSELARAEGFRGSKFHEELRNDDMTWRERIAALDEGRPGLPGGDEPGLGTKTIRIYAVKTPLSRYLFGGSDCVVDCFAAPDLAVEDRIRVVIKAMTGKLDIVRKQQIHFRFPIHKIDDRSSVRLHERLDRLAKSLGFSRSTVAFWG